MAIGPRNPAFPLIVHVDGNNVPQRLAEATAISVSAFYAGSLSATSYSSLTLSGLGDVSSPISPTGGQALVWDSGAGKWKPGSVGGGGGGGTPGGVANSVQYNDGVGGFAGNANLVYNPATTVLSTPKFKVTDTPPTVNTVIIRQPDGSIVDLPLGDGEVLVGGTGGVADGVSVPSPLSLAGGTFTFGTVPIGQGGTNATNAADARTNLGLGTLATLNVGANLFSNGTSLVGTVSAVSSLNDTNFATPPTAGQVLKWDGSKWAPATDSTGGGGSTAAGSTGYVQFNDGFGGFYANTAIQFVSSTSATLVNSVTLGDPYTATNQGDITWDTAYNVITVTDPNNVSYSLGKHSLVNVKNNTGSTLYKGQVVYVSGSQSASQNLLPSLANANLVNTNQTILGIVLADITNTSVGFIVRRGTVTNINIGNAVVGTLTSPTDNGKIIYLSTTNGKWSTSQPVKPNHGYQLGRITNVNGGGTNVDIEVDVKDNFSTTDLHDISDVAQTSTGGILIWNNSSGVYQPSAVFNTNGSLKVINGGTGLTSVSQNDVLVGTGTNVIGIAPLAQHTVLANPNGSTQAVTISTNSILGRQTGNIGSFSVGTNLALNSNTLYATVSSVSALTGDVNITSPTTGQVISWNPTTLKWIASSIDFTPYATTASLNNYVLTSVNNTLSTTVNNHIASAVHWDLTTLNNNYINASGDSANASFFLQGLSATNLSATNLTLFNALPLTQGGTGSTTAGGARTNLGLGTLATLGVGNNLASNGTNLYATVSSVSSLTGDTNFTTTPTNNQALLWNSTTLKWTPATVITTPGGTANQVQYNSGGTSFAGVSLTAGQLLKGTAGAPAALTVAANQVVGYGNGGTDVTALNIGYGLNSSSTGLYNILSAVSSLNDTSITTPTTGKVLSWNNTSLKWVASSIDFSPYVTTGSLGTLASLNVGTNLLSNGTSLFGTVSAVSSLADTNIVSPLTGQSLVWNNNRWEASSVAGGGGGTATPGGASTQVQYNSGGAFAGSNQMTFTVGTNTFSATNITGNGLSGTTVSATNLTLFNALPLTQGGTGSTTAGGARTNLGLGALATLGVGNNLASNGTNLYATVSAVSSLTGDVNVTSPTTGQTLSWNPATLKWIASSIDFTPYATTVSLNNYVLTSVNNTLSTTVNNHIASAVHWDLTTLNNNYINASGDSANASFFLQGLSATNLSATSYLGLGALATLGVGNNLVSNGTNLYATVSAVSGLNDTSITSPTTGKVLSWNNTSLKWVASSIDFSPYATTGSLGTLASLNVGTNLFSNGTSLFGTVSAVSSLNDTLITSPTTGQVLKWNGSKWAPATDSNTPSFGSVAQVQYNDGFNGFSAKSTFTFASATDTLNVTNLTLTNALPLTQGGTGSTTAGGARTNLGLGALATLGVGNNLASNGTNLYATVSSVSSLTGDVNITSPTTGQTLSWSPATLKWIASSIDFTPYATTASLNNYVLTSVNNTLSTTVNNHIASAVHWELTTLNNNYINASGDSANASFFLQGLSATNLSATSYLGLGALATLSVGNNLASNGTSLYATVSSVSALTGDTNFTTPPTNGQTLTWNSTSLKWTPTTPTTASPAGSTGSVQYNNAGVFAADANNYFRFANNTLFASATSSLTTSASLYNTDGVAKGIYYGSEVAGNSTKLAQSNQFYYSGTANIANLTLPTVFVPRVGTGKVVLGSFAPVAGILPSDYETFSPSAGANNLVYLDNSGQFLNNPASFFYTYDTGLDGLKIGAISSTGDITTDGRLYAISPGGGAGVYALNVSSTNVTGINIIGTNGRVTGLSSTNFSATNYLNLPTSALSGLSDVSSPLNPALGRILTWNGAGKWIASSVDFSPYATTGSLNNYVLTSVNNTLSTTVSNHISSAVHWDLNTLNNNYINASGDSANASFFLQGLSSTNFSSTNYLNLPTFYTGLSSTNISATNYLNLPTSALSGLSDVSSPLAPATGRVLAWSSTKWVASALDFSPYAAVTSLNNYVLTSVNSTLSTTVSNHIASAVHWDLNTLNNNYLNASGDSANASFFLQGLSSTNFSATNYLNLPSFYNGLSSTNFSATNYLNLPSFYNGLSSTNFSATNYLNLPSFYNGLSSTNFSATNYLNLPTSALSGLSDVSSPLAPVTGRVLTWSSTKWIASALDFSPYATVTSLNNYVLTSVNNTLSTTVSNHIASAVHWDLNTLNNNYLNASGDSANATFFLQGLSSTNFSATNYLNLPTSALSGLSDVSSPLNPSNGKVLAWSGTKWIASSIPIGGTATSPGGSNTYVQFNNNGAFGGHLGLTYTSSTQTLDVGSVVNTTLVNTNDIFGQATPGSNINFVGNTHSIEITADPGQGDGLVGVLGGFRATTYYNLPTSSLSGLADVSSPLNPSNGKVLTWSGTKWIASSVAAGGGGTPGGSNTQIQFNNAGAFSGTSDITYSSSTNTLIATNVSATNYYNIGPSVAGYVAATSYGLLNAMVKGLFSP